MTFANDSTQTVVLYWLDFTGVERLNQRLVPGESIDVETRQVHPWRLKDALGKRAIGDFVADAGSQVVIVQ